MKILFFTIIFCLFLSLCALGQSSQTEENKQVGVEQIFLAKDDGNGKAGDIATSFLTTDIPLYCIVQLDSMSPVTVKMNLIAVNVKGVKPETKVITVSYKTNGKQSRVNFTGSPDGAWTAGNYRVDIFLDDKPAGKQIFDIQSTAAADAKNIPPDQTKSAPKTKLVRRFKKN